MGLYIPLENIYIYAVWGHRFGTKAEQWNIPMKFAIAINRIGTIAKGVIAIGNHWRRLIASEHKIGRASSRERVSSPV